MRKYKSTLFCIAFVVLQQTGTAQTANKGSGKFQSYNSLQVLMGQSNNSFSIHTVNGLRWNKMFAGIGAGVDFYYHNTLPLFAELRYDLTSKAKKFQVFINGGAHLPLGNANKINPSKTGDFSAGRLVAAGVDYLVPLKKNAVIIGLAFSQKKESQLANNNIWNPVLNRVDNVPVNEAYEFNRLWLRIGFVF